MSEVNEDVADKLHKRCKKNQILGEEQEAGNERHRKECVSLAEHSPSVVLSFSACRREHVIP